MSVGFTTPTLPVLDNEEFFKNDRSGRIRRMAEHWAEVGFGTPVILHLFYVVKIALYIGVGILIVATTPGLGGLGAIGDWWSEPIVFEKVVVYTMLFEILGLGCGFGPLNNRYTPPMGSPLYWLRPGTIRLPPWPKAVPLTAGDTRTVFDAAVYGAVLVVGVIALFTGGAGARPELDTTVGVLPLWLPITLAVLLAVLGLRDNVSFLGARGEVYLPFIVMFTLPGADPIIGAKLVFLLIWFGAAVSKLNRHFPFIISTMMSNNPLVRPQALKRKFFVDFPNDLRPGRLSKLVAHIATAVELVVPFVLYFTHGGWPTAIAAAVMVLFHLGIITAIPMGVPLEWNVFMIFGVLTLFVGHSDVTPADAEHLWLVLCLTGVSLTVVIVGNFLPGKVSFLAGMRYYAGNWDTTLWCIKPSGSAKIEQNVVSIASMPAAQLERVYGADRLHIPLYLGYAFRAMNSHGRALFTLAHRAMAGTPETDYVITDGERIVSTALGWNFGDGHMSDEQLIAALQRRCHFEPGEVRIVILEAQPAHRQTQRYRLVDAATGEFERGEISVADMVESQPWNDELPVRVQS